MLTETGTSHIEAIAADAAKAVISDESVICVVLEPGNGSRYVVVLTRLTPGQAKAIGNDWLLALPDWRTCYPVGLPGYFAGSYLAEKVTKGNMADADVVATYLNAVGKLLAEG